MVNILQLLKALLVRFVLSEFNIYITECNMISLRIGFLTNTKLYKALITNLVLVYLSHSIPRIIFLSDGHYTFDILLILLEVSKLEANDDNNVT